MEPNPKSAKAQYTRLEQFRQPYLDRAREASALTLPFLVPKEGDNGSTNYPTPYQSTGARGVNNLASKLLVALFPPNSPFTRHVLDEYEFKKAKPPVEEGQEDTFKAELEAALADIDRALMREIESSSSRPTFYETLRHLLVAGNGLLFMPQKGGVRLYHLDRYVIKRNPMGHVLEIIVKESVSPTTLPESVQAKLAEYKDSEEERKSVDLYTWVTRKDEESDWESWQEVNDIMLPGTFGTYKKDKSPWVPLRFSKIDGEDYGRGYVEEYLGDLQTLEGLVVSYYEAAAAAAKVVFMVNPNGTTRKVDLANAENGAIIDGSPEEVTVLQAEKHADLQAIWQGIIDLRQNLSRVFLLTEGVQRDAERVTAEEIRTLIQELESSIGGIHALLSEEYQLPVATLFLDRMERQKRLPKLPKSIVKPTIVTGIEAIGRGNDLQKLRVGFQSIAETLGPDVITSQGHIKVIMSKILVAAGVDDEGFWKSAEELAQEQQQAQMMAMIEKLGPNAVNKIGDYINQQQAGAPQG